MAESPESESQETDPLNVNIPMDENTERIEKSYLYISTHHPLVSRFRLQGSSVDLNDPYYYKCMHEAEHRFNANEDLIKTMPLPMGYKRKARSALGATKRSSCTKICGVNIISMCRSSFREASIDPLKHWIEANYGASVATYFSFLSIHIVFFMVVSVFLSTTAFLIPYAINFVEFVYVSKESSHQTIDEEDKRILEQSRNCTRIYEDSLDNSTDSLFIQFITGTGVIRKTWLFYGGINFRWNILFILCNAAYLLISLLCLYIKTLREKSRNLANRHKAFPFCQLLFSSKDCYSYGMMGRKLFVRILRAQLKEQARLDEMSKMTFWEKQKRKLIRNLINVSVIILMILCAVGIFYAVKYTRKFENEEYSNAHHFFLSYVPAIILLILNTLFPLLIEFLATQLYYTPANELQYVISRPLFLRIAFLVVLFFSLIYEVLDCPLDEQTCGSCIDCWEAYIGGEFFKLSVADILSNLLSSIVLNPLRRCMAKIFKKRHNEAEPQSCHYKLLKTIEEFSQPKFSIRVDLLSTVYSQTICWMGFIFYPGIVVYQWIYLLLLYFIKLYQMQYTKIYILPKRNDHVNEVKFIGNFVMLLSVVVSCVTYLYVITRMPPSKGCGAFRNYGSSDYNMISSIYEEIDKRLGSNEWRSIGQTLFKSSFILAFIFLIVITYYFWVKAIGSKRMLKILDLQLDLIRKDKVFIQEQIQKLQFEEKLDLEILGLDKSEKMHLVAQLRKVGRRKMFCVLNACMLGKISKEELFAKISTPCYCN